MRPTHPTQTRRSDAARSRRAQIIAATIPLLARDGVAGTSFVAIARTAGLSSPGLISYHFTDKDELLWAVAEHVVTECMATVRAAVAEAGSATSQLTAYITAFVRYEDEHRDQVSAIWRLTASLTADRAEGCTPDDRAPLVSPAELCSILEAGQASGEFRPFDVRYMAQTIHCAIEGYREWFVAHPDADAGAFIAETTETFVRAARR